jgi:protein phosphatase
MGRRGRCVLITSFGAASHVGAVRAHNEDSVLAVPGMFAVADGMGGHAAGDVASRLAVARLAELAEWPGFEPDDLLVAITAANDDILEVAYQDARRTGMGTTVTGVCVVRMAGTDRLAVFNIGDSRVYRFANGRVTQLTVDHSEVAELVAAGRIAPGAARNHPRRNVITRALGSDPAPELDLWVSPAVVEERLLICSDGLYCEVDDARIARVLATQPAPQAAADTLVTLALRAGGRDNVAVIVLDVTTVSG